jgi:hypothetical protein
MTWIKDVGTAADVPVNTGPLSPVVYGPTGRGCSYMDLEMERQLDERRTGVLDALLAFRVALEAAMPVVPVVPYGSHPNRGDILYEHEEISALLRKLMTRAHR